MPRTEVIKRAANKNGQLALHASANRGSDDFNEHDAFHSDEPYGGMAINQLRVMRE
jgi:hypothetical protein